jgi:ribosomal protein S18 acetylase RimI-like enzyme
VLIRRLNVDDLEALWSLRLQALADNPEAFGSTYEEVMARGKDWMRHRLQEGDDNFFLGAFDERLVGMIGFYRAGGAKERHKGDLISLYVVPERRGQDVGKALVQELIAQAGQLSGLEQLHLTVVASAVVAYHLYRSFGFQVYGTAPAALKTCERYWDEHLMVLHLV